VPELREYRRLVEKANAGEVLDDEVLDDEVLDDEELRVYGGGAEDQKATATGIGTAARWLPVQLGDERSAHPLAALQGTRRPNLPPPHQFGPGSILRCVGGVTEAP
jgi:hypothetical protein